MEKRFYRSATDCQIAGVCGGLAEYFGIDPVLVRVLFAVALICGSLGFWAYLLLWAVAPKR